MQKEHNSTGKVIEKDFRYNCHRCVHGGRCPGGVYCTCFYPGNNVGIANVSAACNIENAQRLEIKFDLRGLPASNFRWPADFDPFLLTNCNGFERRKVKGYFAGEEGELDDM